MSVDFSKIPAELRNLKRWIAWRYVERDGQRTKVPFCARTLETASSVNPAHWTDFETVLKNGKYFRGPGLVIQPPYVGIDLDQARNPQTGEFESWARDIIFELNSYTEISPSGRGFHIWVKGTLPVRGRKTKMVNRVVDPEPNKTPALEVYRDGRYFTMTGQVVELIRWSEGLRMISTKVEERDLTEWSLRHFGEITAEELADATYTPADPDADNDPTASGEEFRIACQVVRDLGISATRDQLCAELVKRAKPRPKLKRKDYVVRTIINAQAAVKLHRGRGEEAYADFF